MDEKALLDFLAANARTIGIGLAVTCSVALLLRTNFIRRLKAVIADMFFTNWRLALLGLTGLVLSLAACWTTWDGMYNFTGEAILSGMVTFGIQGIMLIVAWLIGESFATGMNFVPGPAAAKRFAAASVAVSLLGFALLVGAFAIYAATRSVSEEAWMIALGGSGAAIIAILLLGTFSRNDVVQPYVQAVRIIAKNSMLWVMFFACMAMSVFFSFDSRFNAVFPAAERARVAELRAQNQVSGIVADIGQTIEGERAAAAEQLFQSAGWSAYETQIDGLARTAQESEGAISKYFQDQIEARNRAIKEQRERVTSATSGQAGLASKKTSLTDELSRLKTDRPTLAAEYAEKKGDYDAKIKDVDAKRVEAMAEDKGVEGTGKEGRGPAYRQRMDEMSKLQSAAKIGEERVKDAKKRLDGVETRLAQIERELSAVDGDLAKLKGEAQTAEQRIAATEASGSNATGELIDPARMVPEFAKAKAEFRQNPSVAALGGVQKVCQQIHSAMTSAEATKSRAASFDCDPKQASDAATGLFALNAGASAFSSNCTGGDKLAQHKSTDALFGFATKCLADSGLPSQQTDALRTKIAYAELTRDDRAHRFVVSLNAFNDGNRLAYLAMGIAIALDSLIFMSGLFGANAVRSPLSDVPSNKARTAEQLEATINAALGAHPFDTAWLVLNALRPIKNTDGFSSVAELSLLDRQTADRVRMVLTAGADLGAVEALPGQGESYRVRSELREYLSGICDKHYKTDPSAKDHAKLKQLVAVALEPCPREHADLTLHAFEPIRESKGFTSMVQLAGIDDAYDNRVVRRVINAGAALGVATPAEDTAEHKDTYFIKPLLYETLLTIRATAPENPKYLYDRQRFYGVHHRPAIDAGQLRAQQPELPLHEEPRKLEKPRPALPRLPSLDPEARRELAHHYRAELLGAIGLTPALVDQRLQLEAARRGMLSAWKALNDHSGRNELLKSELRVFQAEQDRLLSEVYSRLVGETGGDPRKRELLDTIEDRIREELVHYMLFPETKLVAGLIEEIERAAQADDGLQHGEQDLKEQLLYVREGLGELNLSSAQAWDEIRERLAVGYRRDLPNILNRFAPRQDRDPRDQDS